MMIIALAGVAFTLTGHPQWLIVGIALAASVGPLTQIAGTGRNGRLRPLTPGWRLGIALLTIIAALVLFLAAIEAQTVATWLIAGVFWLGIGLTSVGALLRGRVSRGDPTVHADPEAAPPE